MKLRSQRSCLLCLLPVLALAFCACGCGNRTGETAFRRGMRALDKGRTAESVLWFQRSIGGLAEDSERALALNALGVAYYRLNRPTAAAAAFESARAADQSAMAPVYNLGLVSLETGDENKAIACFEKASLLHDKDVRALEFLGVIFNRRGQWDDARRVLNEAAIKTSRTPRILTALATSELGAKNVDRAMELLQEALEQDARYAPAIYNLAVINQKWLSRGEQAMELYSEYARLSPRGPHADRARTMMAEIAAASERDHAVKAAENRPPPSPPSQPQPVFPTFDELMEVGAKLEKQGRREAAFNNYLRIARAAEQAGKTAVQTQAVRRAAALTDNNPQAAYDLGVYFAERKMPQDAADYFRKAAGQGTNTYYSAMALYRIAMENSEHDAAIVALKKADALAPENPEALWLLANLYDHGLALSNSAASAYASFAERFPDDPRAAEASAAAQSASNTGPRVDNRSLLQKIFSGPAGGRQEPKAK